MSILKINNFFGNVLNVGSNNEYSVETIAKKILRKFNSNAKIKIEQKRIRSSKSEVLRLVCDNKKILKHTKWKPKVNFDKGLDLTIGWFKEFKGYFRHDIYHV